MVRITESQEMGKDGHSPDLLFLPGFVHGLGLLLYKYRGSTRRPCHQRQYCQLYDGHLSSSDNTVESEVPPEGVSTIIVEGVSSYRQFTLLWVLLCGFCWVGDYTKNLLSVLGTVS